MPLHDKPDLDRDGNLVPLTDPSRKAPPSEEPDGASHRKKSTLHVRSQFGEQPAGAARAEAEISHRLGIVGVSVQNSLRLRLSPGQCRAAPALGGRRGATWYPSSSSTLCGLPKAPHALPEGNVSILRTQRRSTAVGLSGNVLAPLQTHPAVQVHTDPVATSIDCCPFVSKAKPHSLDPPPPFSPLHNLHADSQL
ncbi:hypothetical protein VUR80DRAFT_5783 [Thermomyces stellatus]